MDYKEHQCHVYFQVLVIQLCPTFCDSMNCSPPGSSVRGIFQARVLEWVAIPTSRGIKPRSPALQAGSLLSEYFQNY